MNLKEDYSLAKCCAPTLADTIVGYFSHDNIIKVHSYRCSTLKEIEPERLLFLQWQDILAKSKEFTPDDDYFKLDQIDFAILKHHHDYGIDYSLVVARKIRIGKQEGFDRHMKLRKLNLLKRVQARIVRYRKGIVDNRWIKHRHHTYYQLTELGENYIDFYLSNK